MTDAPAVFQADFVDLAFKPGLKCARLSFDIPIEHAAAFIQAFGAPDRVSPAKCAIARLKIPGPDDAVEAARPPEARADDREKPRKHFKEMPLSQQCALKLRDEGFNDWILDRDRDLYYRFCIDQNMPHWDAAEAVVKQLLGIASKKELDTDPAKGAAWLALLTEFDCRSFTR